jgi:hypothetical protein
MIRQMRNRGAAVFHDFRRRSGHTGAAEKQQSRRTGCGGFMAMFASWLCSMAAVAVSPL